MSKDYIFSLCVHFRILRFIFIVKLSVSPLRKCLSEQIIVTLPFRSCKFLNFLLFCLALKVFWRYICIMFCLCMKKNGNFLHFNVLSLSNLYKQKSYSFQFVEKFDNLSSVFRCSYDIESTIYSSYTGLSNLSQVYPPYTWIF